MATRRLEQERIFNCIPSREIEKDWSYTNALEAGILAAAPVPPEKDLREPWWNVGDQGQTGSCVGWACADSVLRWHFVKAGRLGAKEALSPRYVWMAAKETDEFTSRPTTFVEVAGTSLKAALDIARKYGVATDSVLPFSPPTLYQGKEQTLYAVCAQRRIASYYNLGRDPKSWRSWIAQQGPILTRLDVDETFARAKETDGKLDRYDSSFVYGGHAVALVGYTRDSFIVRNSWGTRKWGDRGFGYASMRYTERAFTEAYGVEV